MQIFPQKDHRNYPGIFAKTLRLPSNSDTDLIHSYFLLISP